MEVFLKSQEELLETLETDREKGLSQEDVMTSREKHGENSFTREKPPGFFKRFFSAMKEPMVLLLLLAGAITLGINISRYMTGGETDFFECVGIFLAIALSVLITVLMEGKSSKAFEALSRLGEDSRVKALRDGVTTLISQKEVVVGDILRIETGDRLPADGRVLDANELMSDESALTGESHPVEKRGDVLLTNPETPIAERNNMLYSGCFITGGSGTMVVTAVGDHTEFGKIAGKLAGVEKKSTPLEEKMALLGKRIASLGMIAAALVFIMRMVTMFRQGTTSLDLIFEALITSIVLIVAAVPEGLPTIVAISLAINVMKMSKQNALVKKMVACETVGCINVICSDKTGTLTENRMTVTGIYADGQISSPESMKQGPMMDNFCINSTAELNHGENGPVFVGNPTECALLIGAQKSGIAYNDVRKENPVHHLYAFSSDTKRMTTVVARGEGYTVFSKGGPEQILSRCSLTPEAQSKIEQEMRGFQEKACRIIAFGHKNIDKQGDFENNREETEQGLTFDGFAAISDPLRKDVQEAVRQCSDAGISLKMLTGDHIITARAIAEELGLFEDGGRAVEAAELAQLDDVTLTALLPEIKVIARSTPEVKLRVVNALKAQGNVVAVTGDGINDAPAIKHADVGLAMGITGTEVSKQASDIVLLDDSFSTIVRAVRWGRGIYENFRRFIRFQLTVNLSSVVVVLASVICGLPAPFTALELLWINLIMDGPPALMLGLEPVGKDVMRRKPTKRSEGIVSKEMMTHIVVGGIFMSILCMGQNLFNFLGAATGEEHTVLFSLFVLLQLFNALGCRALGGASPIKTMLTNPMLLVALVATFALQVVIVQVGGAVFSVVPLSMMMWGKITAVAATIVLLSEATAFFIRKQ